MAKKVNYSDKFKAARHEAEFFWDAVERALETQTPKPGHRRKLRLPYGVKAQVQAETDKDGNVFVSLVGEETQE